MQELLIAALSQSISSTLGPLPRLQLDVENHGREGSEISLAQSVGWFTAHYPIAIEIAGELNTTLESLRQTLAQCEGQETSFGLLRHLSPDAAIRAKLAARPRSSLLVNFLGTNPGRLLDSKLFAAARDLDQHHDPDAARPHALEFAAWIAEDQLEIQLVFSREEIQESKVAEILDATLAGLRQLAGGVDLTPQDFPNAGIDQSDLDDILKNFDV